MVEKRPALGRGLSALIPERPPRRAAERALDVDIDLLRPEQVPAAHARWTTRGSRSSRGRSAPTASSSRSSCAESDDGYEIVAGERRWRAAQRAGLLKVPVVVRDIPDDRLLAVALIENIQREDLNPIEEAHAYRRLADEFHLTQEQIADAVGKDRSSIANYVRLLKLPHEVRDERRVAARLSMGHARALLGARRRSGAAARSRATSSRKQLSVRETEALDQARRSDAGSRAKPNRRRTCTRAPPKSKLRFALGTASASSARAKAAGSRSISVAKTSCSASTST